MTVFQYAFQMLKDVMSLCQLYRHVNQYASATDISSWDVESGVLGDV